MSEIQLNNQRNIEIDIAFVNTECRTALQVPGDMFKSSLASPVCMSSLRHATTMEEGIIN